MTGVEALAATLFAAPLAVTLLAPFLPSRWAQRLAAGVSALLTLLLAYTAYAALGSGPVYVFSGTLVIDPYGALLAFAVTFASLLAVVAAGPVVNGWITGPAFYSLAMLMLFGVYALVFTADLLVVMTAWILASVASYAASALARDPYSVEGAVKYALMGSASSTLLMIGIIFYFALARGTHVAPGLAPPTGFTWIAALATMVFIVAAVGFKMGVFPFQTWLPDAYGGVHPALVAFIIGVSKVMGVATLYRLTLPLAEAYPHYWFTVVAAFSVLTMTYGNLGALVQNDVQRMIAYSSIANAGYFLVGFAALAPLPGMRRDWALMGIAIHIVAYVLSKVGSFTLLSMVRESLGTTVMKVFRGLSLTAPASSASFIILLLSLMGMPPLLGFWSKVYLFASVVYYAPWLALIALLNTVVSIAYYARIIRAVYFDRPEEKPGGVVQHREQVAVLLITAVLSVLLALGVLQVVVEKLLPL